MPVQPKTLKKHGERCIILMDGKQTLSDALQRLHKSDYPTNQAYFIVSRADKQYQVAHFSHLERIVAMMGYDSFTRPLDALPLPFADRIVPTDTPQSGLEIVDWVASKPQSTVVVIEDERVVGLFVNPNRSGDAGLLGGLSLLRIHGEFVQLCKDPRAKLSPVPPPQCPHCQEKNFFEFDLKQGIYVCPNCGKAVTQL